MDYKTVADFAQSSFIEKKSEFIGYIMPVVTENEAIDFIEKIKAQHRKATHNCYAYILRNNNISRHSDDGEPSGTAGVPMYEVINKEGLTDVCCVVTRYFGGILLGAGGLVRAYSRGVSDVIAASKIKEMRPADRLNINLDYTMYGKIAAINSEYDCRIISEDFSDKVDISVFIREAYTKPYIEKLTDITNGRAIIKIAQKEYIDFS